MIELKPLERAVDIMGGKRPLAEAIGYTDRAVHYWLTVREGRPVAEAAPLIERATGGAVTAAELRPDLWPSPAETQR